MSVLVHHRPADQLGSSRTPSRRPKVRIAHANTLEALGAHHKSRSVALVFASARTPGGGWRAGLRGQEEDLCRCTQLGALLESPSARPYYEHPQVRPFAEEGLRLPFPGGLLEM